MSGSSSPFSGDISSEERQVIGVVQRFLEGHNKAAAEEELSRLRAQPGFSVALLRIALRENAAPMAVRQFCGVHLKLVIQRHWHPLAQSFQPPALADAEQQALRRLLPRGLSLPDPLLRAALAAALAAVALIDWPHAWPSLITDLLTALFPPPPPPPPDAPAPADAPLHRVHGALRCLSLFAQSGQLSDQQAPRLVPLLGPAMLRLYRSQDAHHHPPALRLRALPLTAVCVTALLMLRGTRKADADALLKKLVPAWLPHFAAALARPLVADGRDEAQLLGLSEKIYVLGILQLLYADWPQPMVPALPKLLPPVFQSIVGTAAAYQRCAVEEDRLEQTAHKDEDGDALGFEALVQSLLDFLRILIEHRALRKALAHNMPHILFYAIAYMQITADEASRWAADIDEFVANEQDLAALSTSVRNCAARLLDELFDRAARDGSLPDLAAAFAEAVRRHHAQVMADDCPFSPDHRWKVLEAINFAVGMVQKYLFTANQSVADGPIFDFPWFFRTILVPAMKPIPQFKTSVFLRARALWTAGRCSANIPKDQIVPFLKSSVDILKNPHDNPALKVGSCLALRSFLPKVDPTITRSILGQIIPLICGLLSSVSVNTLHLLLSTLHQALLVPLEEDDSSIAAKVVPIAQSVLKIWSKHHNNPDVAEDLTFVFAALAEAARSNLGALLEILAVPLSSILSQHPDKSPALSQTALGVLEGVIAPVTRGLPPFMYTKIFPAVMRLGMCCDDNQILQSVAHVLAGFLHASIERLAEVRPIENKPPALTMVIQFLQRTLTNPNLSDHALAYSDALIIQLFLLGSATHINPSMQQTILRAVFEKMYQTSFPSIRHNMLFVFVRLIIFNPGMILSFLAQVKTPNGTSGLEAVLSEWAKIHEDLLGHYRLKISCMAMIKLIEMKDARLNSIKVPGDLLVNLQEARSSRSQGKKQLRYSQIPLPAKFLKLLIGEHQSLEEPEDELSNSQDSDDGDVDIYEESEDGPFAPADDYAQYLMADGGDDSDDDAEDVVVTLDPLNQIELLPFIEEHLSKFLHEPATRGLLGALNTEELDYCNERFRK